jgi:putative ABC transport system permease protein
VAPAPNTDPRATLVYVLADDASNVAAVADQATKLTGLDTDGLTIRTSDQLVAVHDVLSGQIGGFARQLAVGVLALGLVLVLLTVSLALSSRRADMGRRRALGSSRSALTVLLLLAVGLGTLPLIGSCPPARPSRSRSAGSW